MFTKNGGFVTSWGNYGTADGEFNTQMDIDVDSNHDIFVVYMNNHRIQKLDKNGNFITKWSLINPSMNLDNEYQMLSIYAVPNSIATAAIIPIIEKFSSCYISKVSQVSQNIHK